MLLLSRGQEESRGDSHKKNRQEDRWREGGGRAGRDVGGGQRHGKDHVERGFFSFFREKEPAG